MSSFSWKSLFVGAVVGAMVFATVPVVAGVGDAVLQGKINRVNKRTVIQGKSLATLRLVNTNADGTALVLDVESGNPPLKVNSKKKVVDLNVDLLDGRSSSFFMPREAQPGQTLVGAFGAAGDGTFLVHAASFDPPLETGIPQSKIHYVLPDAGTIAECPSVFQATAGHLCIYAAWERNVSFSGIGRINNEMLNSGASRHGFTILWTGSSSSANVRGNWAYTVPSNQGDAALEREKGLTTELGVLPAP